METQNISQHSQQAATRPYPEPDKSTLRASCLLPSGFPTKSLYAFLFSPTRATGLVHIITRHKPHERTKSIE
jgi:hypothetical protein